MLTIARFAFYGGALLVGGGVAHSHTGGQIWLAELAVMVGLSISVWGWGLASRRQPA